MEDQTQPSTEQANNNNQTSVVANNQDASAGLSEENLTADLVIPDFSYFSTRVQIIAQPLPQDLIEIVRPEILYNNQFLNDNVSLISYVNNNNNIVTDILNVRNSNINGGDLSSTDDNHIHRSDSSIRDSGSITALFDRQRTEFIETSLLPRDADADVNVEDPTVVYEEHSENGISQHVPAPATLRLSI